MKYENLEIIEKDVEIFEDARRKKYDARYKRNFKRKGRDSLKLSGVIE